MTKGEIKQELMANIESVPALHTGLIVSQVALAFEVLPQTATAALIELVNEGVLRIETNAGGVNVYAAA